MTRPESPGLLSRRAWLSALPALAAMPVLGRAGLRTSRGRPGQAAPLAVTGLRSVTLSVADVDRSLDFYRSLFGLPVLARHRSTVALGVGAGPGFLVLEPAGPQPPAISRFGLALGDFDVDAVTERLAEHGVVALPDGGAALPGPMQLRRIRRGADSEVYLGDPHGMVVQLHHPRDCGREGEPGRSCAAGRPEPVDGALGLLGFSHLTNNATDPARAVDFYRRVFGLDVQTHQAASPLLGVGSGDEFLMFIGGTVGRDAAEATLRPGRVHHVCFTVADYGVERVQTALERHGIRPRDVAAPGPLRHWISLRMPDRGGAPDGTPELYFSDPDGLSIQLQDLAYCGGGGRLGDVCE